MLKGALLGLAALILQVAAFPPAADFSARGSFKTVNHQEGPDCTIFRPATLGEGGLKHPIILWGNGTNSRPVDYAGLLTHWASQGFVVAAANSPSAGSGAQMIACLDWLTQRDAAAGNPYSAHLDLAHVGAAGHSQGAGGALMAGRDGRITTTVPFMPPASQAAPWTAQHGPMLLLSGSADVTTPPARSQGPIFETANVPVVWATLATASHLSAGGDAGPYRAISTAWFRSRLMGDATAGRMFDGEACSLCSAPGWLVRRRD